MTDPNNAAAAPKPAKPPARGALVRPSVSDADRQRFMKAAHDPVIAPPPLTDPAPAAPAAANDQPASTAPPAENRRTLDRRTKATTKPEAAPAPATNAKPKPKPKSTGAGPAAGVTPWAHAHPKVKNNTQVRMPEELDLKLACLSARMPGRMSKHQIILDAIEAYLPGLLDEYYYGKGKTKSK